MGSIGDADGEQFRGVVYFLRAVAAVIRKPMAPSPWPRSSTGRTPERKRFRWISTGIHSADRFEDLHGKRPPARDEALRRSRERNLATRCASVRRSDSAVSRVDIQGPFQPHGSPPRRVGKPAMGAGGTLFFEAREPIGAGEHRHRYSKSLGQGAARNDVRAADSEMAQRTRRRPLRKALPVVGYDPVRLMPGPSRHQKAVVTSHDVEVIRQGCEFPPHPGQKPSATITGRRPGCYPAAPRSEGVGNVVAQFRTGMPRDAARSTPRAGDGVGAFVQVDRDPILCQNPEQIPEQVQRGGQAARHAHSR